ncbi:unnamed protein product, partial [Adineta steineri]
MPCCVLVTDHDVGGLVVDFIMRALLVFAIEWV